MISQNILLLVILAVEQKKKRKKKDPFFISRRPAIDEKMRRVQFISIFLTFAFLFFIFMHREGFLFYRNIIIWVVFFIKY